MEGWGADSNLFHQGAAKETQDPEVVAATMAQPDVILRRPVGSKGPFTEHAALPTSLGHDETGAKARKQRAKPEKQPPRKTDDKVARKAALEYEKVEKRRENKNRRKKPRGRRRGSEARRQLPRQRQLSKGRAGA